MKAVWTKAERDKALALLPDEGAWCQREAAHGRAVCARHVIYLISARETKQREESLRDAFLNHVGAGVVTVWNDQKDRTFADVRRAFETIPVVEDSDV